MKIIVTSGYFFSVENIGTTIKNNDFNQIIHEQKLNKIFISQTGIRFN